MGLWDGWSMESKHRYLMDNDLAFQAALDYEEHCRSVFRDIRKLIKIDDHRRLKHDERVLKHYFRKINDLMQWWIFEKRLYKAKQKSNQKFVWVIGGAMLLLGIIPWIDSRVIFTGTPFENLAYLIISLLAILGFRDFYQMHLMQAREEANSLKLDRMIDAVGEITGCTITFGFIRVLTDYQDTPVEDALNEWSRATLALKYVSIDEIDGLDKNLEWDASRGILKEHWLEIENKIIKEV